MLYYEVLHKGFLSVLGVHKQVLTLNQHPFHSQASQIQK